MNVRGRYLVDGEGNPFFWLADTAWNLWCKGTDEEWERYLVARKAQGFNVVQFVAGWWRGCMQPIHGRPFDLQDGQLVFNESAWESLDRLFELIDRHGMVASPIMLWTLTDIDPGQVLSEDQCVAVGRKQVQRWQNPNIVWMLGGDGNYTDPAVEARWKRIGRAVFGEDPNQLATMHPCGTTWVGSTFSSEPWYRIATIQSGHGSSDQDLRFLVDGDYARAWQDLNLPFLNLEPNYEDARSYQERLHLTAYHVRRASYWSLLVAPPAGITYGIGSVWMWATTSGEIAENHDESWVGEPWHTQLDTPGARSMTILRQVFGSLPWTAIQPANELLADQPGHRDPRHWQTLATSDEGLYAILYCPTGGSAKLRCALPTLWSALDPASGEAVPCTLEDTRLTGGPTTDGDVLFIGRPR